MSLIPFLIDLNRESRPSPRWYNDFGYGVDPFDILEPMLYNPRRELSEVQRELARSLKNKGNDSFPLVGKDGFQVSMNVEQFQPNELTVKTVDDYVVVEGKHEEKEDNHGYISRHFVRKYHLPKGFNAKDVVTSLSSDGVLTVKAPPAQSIESNERVLQIQQTGPARLSVKENGEPTEKKESKDKKK